MGNRTSDTRVGTYGYADPSNPGRLTDAGGDALSYDANGNVTAYAADRSRYRRHEVLPDGTRKTTRYVGKAFERTLTRDPGGSTTTKDRYFIHAAGRLVAIHTENRTTNQARNRFLHRDSLGTVTLITDALGNVVERYAFRPFGERVVLENSDNPYTGTALAGVTPSLKRGFTGHEHIEGVGLIHMNGRIYDPRLGRFLSADPHVQFPDDARGYNRYVYVQNNPLKYSDPSGYFVSVFVGLAFNFVAQELIKNAFLAAFVAAFATGAYLSGGDFEVALQAGVFALASAGLAYEVGHGGLSLQGVTKHLAHGVSQGAISEAAGGDFKSGFVGAFAGSSLENVDLGLPDDARVVNAAIVGGTASALSGGSFGNGAVSAAFVEMFNHQGEGRETRGRNGNMYDQMDENFLRQFENQYPVEHFMFKEYALGVDMTHWADEVRMFELAWRGFGPYARTRSIELISEKMRSFYKSLYGPENALPYIGGRIGIALDVYNNASSVASGVSLTKLTQEALNIRLHGPSLINEQTFESAFSRGYDDKLNALVE